MGNDLGLIHIYCGDGKGENECGGRAGDKSGRVWIQGAFCAVCKVGKKLGA